MRNSPSDNDGGPRWPAILILCVMVVALVVICLGAVVFGLSSGLATSADQVRPSVFAPARP